MDKKLSPIAESVVDAYDGAPISDFDIGDRIAVGAAIRTAAHKVYSEIHYGRLFRDKLLAIADELEGIYPEKPDSSIDGNSKDKLTSYHLIPISFDDRLPGSEDCDNEGCVWVWDNFNRQWDFAYIRTRPKAQFPYCTHWLPYYALPIPVKG